MKNICLILVLSVLFSSCHKKEKDYIGGWAITRINYLNSYYYRYDKIYSNFIFLNSDKSCDLPNYMDNPLDTFYEKGVWRIEQR
jgi:hypothetical protein